MAIHLEFFKICKCVQSSVPNSETWFLFELCIRVTLKYLLCYCYVFLLNFRTPTIESKQKLWFTHVFLAGCTGGVIKAFFACPIELTKVRLQVKARKSRICRLCYENHLIFKMILNRQ